MSLLHPFGFDYDLDEDLENFFGLCMPFLNFRVGIQGVEESFSFILTKADEDYYYNDESVSKMMELLEISQNKRQQSVTESRLRDMREGKRNKFEDLKVSTRDGARFNAINSDISSFRPLTEEEDFSEFLPEIRFFNSDYWKISNYLSTVLPTFFFSLCISIVDYQKDDI